MFIQKENIASLQGDSTETIIIPCTVNNENLSSVIIVKEAEGGYIITCYNTNGRLYELCHDANMNVDAAEKLLLLFFYMENKTYGTTKFYHIPLALFAAVPGDTLPDNSKLIQIAVKDPPPDISGMAYLPCVMMQGPFCNCADPAACDWETGCAICTISDCEFSTTGGGSHTGGDIPGDPPGGDPDNPGNGGNNGSGCTYNCPAPDPCRAGNSWYRATPDEPCNPGPIGPNPCDTIIAQLQNDANFKSNFNYLKGPDILGLSFETGFLVRRIGNIYLQQSGNADSKEIDWFVNGRIDGVLHSHYAGLSSMFSTQDLIFMAQIYLAGMAVDSTSLFFGVTSTFGQPALMKVENTAAFRAFAIKIAGADGRDKKRKEKFIEQYYDKFNSGNNPDTNEREFLQMLRDEGVLTGLSLYRGNSDCSKWKKLALSNQEVIETNCY